MRNKESRKFLETARRICGANKRKGLLCFALLFTSLLYCDGSGNGSGNGSGGPDGPGDPAPPPPPPLAISSFGAGGQHVCALLNSGDLKCWGNNNNGVLGLELNKKDSIGDEPMEMGSNLPAVDLGSGRTVETLAVGSSHVCAILDDESLKCWGANFRGRLGLGDENDRGDNMGEMGDNLPALDLGTGRTVETLAVGSNSRLRYFGRRQPQMLGR